MLSWNNRQTEMSHSLNLSAFMPKHKQEGEDKEGKGGRQTVSKMEQNRLRIRESERGEA